ncbi:hypothetical protein NRB16_08075 [Pseudomonas sp. LJDD11]|uniref:hypothetical protein n=1 Tax=Pseudomonas sp. LJDD11 TaxID=2931984 RepID=UPI00211C3F6F|nr:hypothetical protein [Pseudomonas sp. LJDD11]MCQ9423477.1 hypothetical protein [Pseudomonas sp. LJDD11]
MELTYSAQASDFDPEKRYRNPIYFDKPEPGVTKVTVVGEWPAVVDAYKAANVETSVVKAAKAKKPSTQKPAAKPVFAVAEGEAGKWLVTGADGAQVGEPYDTKELAEAEAKRQNEAE